MAFGFIGAALTAQSSTANQASTLTASFARTAGRLYVIVVAVDNNQTTDGDEGAVTSITHSGESFTKAAEFTNGQGAAQAGATVSIWYLVAAANAGNNTGTINFSNSTSRDKSASTVGEFTRDTTQTIAVEATNTLANDGADPGSLNATTANIECLRVRGIAAETNSITALTPTTNWTAWDGNQTGGGGSAANMAVRAEHRISTGTGDASDPTLFAADCASVYVAFKEVIEDNAEEKVNLQAEHEFRDDPGLDLAIAEPPDEPPPPDNEQITLALDDPEVEVPPGLDSAEARQGDDVFDEQVEILLALDIPEVEEQPGLDLTLDISIEDPIVEDAELILNLAAEHEVLVELGLDSAQPDIEDHVFGHETIQLGAEHEVIEEPGVDLTQDRPFDDVFDAQDEIGLALDDPEVVEQPGLNLEASVPEDHVFEVEDFQLSAEHEVVEEPGVDLAQDRPTDDVFDDAPEIVQLEALVEIDEISGVNVWEPTDVGEASVVPADNEQIVALLDDVQVEDIPGLDFTVTFPFDFVEADYPEVVHLAAEEPYLDDPGDSYTEAMQPDSVFGDGAEIVQLEAEPAPDDLVPDSVIVNLTDEFDAGDPLEFLPGPLDMPMLEEEPGVDLTVLSHAPFDDAPPVGGVTRRPNNPMIYSTGAMMRR